MKTTVPSSWTMTTPTNVAHQVERVEDAGHRDEEAHLRERVRREERRSGSVFRPGKLKREKAYAAGRQITADAIVTTGANSKLSLIELARFLSSKTDRHHCSVQSLRQELRVPPGAGERADSEPDERPDHEDEKRDDEHAADEAECHGRMLGRGRRAGFETGSSACSRPPSATPWLSTALTT